MNSLIRFFTLRFDRTFSGHGRTQFAWLAGVLLLFFGFIYLISWFFSFPEPTDTPSSNSGTEVPMGRLLQLICLFIDPGSVANVPAELRWFSLIVAIMGLLLFTGLLISVVSNMLERHVERYREGNISYPLEKHVVIIGFDEMVPMLVLQICTDPQYEDCYILIQSVQPSSEVRNRIHTVLDTEQEKRVLVLHAQRNSTEELEKLYTTSAREIFLIGESNEYDHDSLNIDSLQKIVAIHRKKSNCPRITVSVLFEYQTTYAAFQVSDLAEEWRKQIDFHPFNFYEEWAKKLLVKRHYGEENAKVEYPASFMLIAATNPCPCGYFGDGDKCTCAPNRRIAYLSKLSGPILDRIDIQLWLAPVSGEKITGHRAEEPSEKVASRVLNARRIQTGRYKGTDTSVNAEMSSRQMEKFCVLDEDCKIFMNRMIDRYGLSVRAYSRMLKLARTIADLAGQEKIALEHLSEASRYRILDKKDLLM